ncbi:hypothetical protein LZ32DRAFT_664107 [Colletotrichum eremochloae]|nr:hypothetical protein LZ32DRAFT_664107 [Colletotrichum eremochloae]
MPIAAPLAASCAGLSKAPKVFAEIGPWMRASDCTPGSVTALYEAVTAEIGAPGAAGDGGVAV